MYTIIWLYLMKNSCCKCGLLYKLFCTCKEKHDAAWSSNKINTNIFFSHFLYLLGFLQCILLEYRGRGKVTLMETLLNLFSEVWVRISSWANNGDGEIGWGAIFKKKTFKMKNIYWQYSFSTCITCLVVGQVPLTLLLRFPVLYSCN